MLQILLEVLDVDEGDENVENAIEEPEHIVYVVNFVHIRLRVLHKAHIVEEQWMVSEEVECEGDIVDGAPEDHALWGLLVGRKPGVNACNQWNFLAEAEDFPCH